MLNVIEYELGIPAKIVSDEVQFPRGGDLILLTVFLDFISTTEHNPLLILSVGIET